MTKERAKHYRQLATFYAIVVATGFLWRPHTPMGMAVILVAIFGLAPWLVLRQPDHPDD